MTEDELAALEERAHFDIRPPSRRAGFLILVSLLKQEGAEFLAGGDLMCVAHQVVGATYYVRLNIVHIRSALSKADLAQLLPSWAKPLL
jgi:hypothetical protein